eukprot:10480464-Lingulodinium_polyedra.AAC.1
MDCSAAGGAAAEQPGGLDAALLTRPVFVACGGTRRRLAGLGEEAAAGLVVQPAEAPPGAGLAAVPA